MALEVFKPGAGRVEVLLSAHPEHGRVQRIGALPTRGLERDTPFSLVARKHLRNARIRSLHQPRLERVLELDCEQRDAAGQHYGVLVIVEAMGRRSNLVLVGRRWRDPGCRAAQPAQPQSAATRSAAPALRATATAGSSASRTAHARRACASSRTADPVRWRRFSARRLAGLSPQAARELAFRFSGTLDAPIASTDWSALLPAIGAFFNMTWSPTLALEDGQPIALCAVSPHAPRGAGRRPPGVRVDQRGHGCVLRSRAAEQARGATR